MTLLTAGPHGVDMAIDLGFSRLQAAAIIADPFGYPTFTPTTLELLTGSLHDLFTDPNPWGYGDENGNFPGYAVYWGQSSRMDLDFVFRVEDFQIPFATLKGWIVSADTASAFQRLFGASDTFRGGSGNDRLAAFAGSDSMTGGLGDDTLDGGSADGAGNLLRGDEGNDSLVGGADFDDLNGNMGDDTVAGGAGGDWAVGGKDHDLLYGGDGPDIVWGNLGNDTSDGGGGDDQVRGGQGDDSVGGGAGDDFVSGDRGDDTITGGAGADLFHGSQDAGLDRVLDFDILQGDRVLLDPGTTFILGQVGADTVVDLGGSNQMVLVGVQLSALPAGWIFGA